MTRQVKVGNVYIGGGAGVSIQSMTNTPTENAQSTIEQIHELEKAGVDIVRCSVNTLKASEAIKDIVLGVHVPVVADIHFDYKLAINSIENGVAKVRINPGNIGDESKVKAVVDCAKMHHIPIRVGVNSGSIESEIQDKYGNGAEALYNSAMKHVRLLEKYGFYDTVISAKASDVKRTIEAYRYLHNNSDYPLHLGVTEAGVGDDSLVKSACAMGGLLFDGIGDTIRVSMTGSPIPEVEASKKILRAIGLDKDYVEIVACPTCARCSLNSEELVNKLKIKYSRVTKRLKVAVMGCVVNGVGEGKDADIGVAGGKDTSAIFTHGKILYNVPNDKIYETLTTLIDGEINNK